MQNFSLLGAEMKKKSLTDGQMDDSTKSIGQKANSGATTISS
jgi:hypothetical protein